METAAKETTTRKRERKTLIEKRADLLAKEKARIYTSDRKVNLFQAVANFYCLEEIAAYAPTADPFNKAQVKLVSEVEAFKAEYDVNLANLIYDYLTLAVYGEMRHTPSSAHINGQWKAEDESETEMMSHLKKSVWFKGLTAGSRKQAVLGASHFNPKDFLPLASFAFGRKAEMPESCDEVMPEPIVNPMLWSSAYGGPKWGVIARAAMMFWTAEPSVFIDHCVDLMHNGSLAFDKGMFVRLSEVSTYMAMLDEKKMHSAMGLRDACTFDVLSFCERAMMTGLVPNSPVKYNYNHMKDEVDSDRSRIEFPKPITWGQVYIWGSYGANLVTELNAAWAFLEKREAEMAAPKMKNGKPTMTMSDGKAPKVGDIVECLTAYDGNSHVMNQLGIVISVGYTNVSVEFKNNVHGHNDNGGKQGHVWNVKPACLKEATWKKVKEEWPTMWAAQGHKTTKKAEVK